MPKLAQESTVMRNISLGLGIAAVIIGSAVSVYAYINSAISYEIKNHEIIARTLSDEKYFPKENGIITQTEIKEINKKLDHLIITNEKIYQELLKK